MDVLRGETRQYALSCSLHLTGRTLLQTLLSNEYATEPAVPPAALDSDRAIFIAPSLDCARVTA
jgi:hypothetical protein